MNIFRGKLFLGPPVYFILLYYQPLGDLEMEKPLHLDESLKQQQAVEERRRSREVILIKIVGCGESPLVMMTLITKVLMMVILVKLIITFTITATRLT